MFEENGVCIEVYISQMGCGYSWRCTRVEDDDINKDKKRRIERMVKCDECMMYDPYDGYCRYFQEFIDEGYDCSIAPKKEEGD